METESQSRTADKIAKAAHEAAEKIATTADHLESRIRQTTADAQHNVRDTKDRAQRMSEDLINDVRDYVHERPVASIMMAFAAGIIFSTFLRR